MEMSVSKSPFLSCCGPLNSCTLKSASSASPPVLASCSVFSGCWVLNFCMDSSWLISSRTFLLTCWLLLRPPAMHLMEYSTGGRSGTASQLPRSLKQRASQGCSTNAENCSQRADRAMIDLLISSSFVWILEQILTMRIRQAKKPSCELLMARRNWLRSPMRPTQLPTVISIRFAWQKRYFRYSSNTPLSELNTRKNTFSTILCTIDSEGSLNSSDISSSMYFTRFTVSTTFREESYSAMLKIQSTFEWQSVKGLALLSISVILGMSSMTVLGKGCDSSLYWFRLLSYRFWGSSVLKEERQQQRISQPTILAAASEMVPPQRKISMTRATFSWLVMISSMVLPSAIRQYFSMISTSTSPAFSMTVSQVPSVFSFLQRSKASRTWSQSWRMTWCLRATLSGGELLFLVRSRLRQSRRVLTTALEQQCLARRGSGCWASQTRSIVSLYRLFQRMRLNCEKYPQSSGSSSSSLPRNSKKAFMKKVRWVVGSTLKKELITQVVFVSIISIVSSGSLYFLLSLSDSAGASVMYLMISLGISRELVMYSSNLGWQALRSSRKSGYSRSWCRAGCESTSASSFLVESLWVLYQLMRAQTLIIGCIYIYTFKSALPMESLYYEFQLKVNRIYLELDSSCDVQFWWKRSKQKATSKKYRINERVQYVELNEGLKTCVKIKFKDGKPNPFTTDITVLLYPLSNSNSCKQGGAIENLDLTQILIPENKKASVSRQFERKLEKSLPNSKILFTLSSKFLREAGNEQSLNDISFQGATQSHFNHSQTDMTFRPPMNSEERNRKTSRTKEMVPIMRPSELEEKLQSPLQRVDYIKVQGHRPQESEFVKNDKPLGFSFGPVGNPERNPERQRQNRALLEEVNELREQLSNQKRQNQRLVSQIRAREAERNSGVDDKKLILLNQLNAAVNQCDQLKREKDQILSQLNKLKEDYRKIRDDVKEKEILYGKAKDQNRELTFNFNKLRDQLSDCSQKYQSKKKQSEQMRPRLQKLQRQNQQMKNQLFKKQSQLINNENQLENVKMQCTNANKNVVIVEQLKRVNQDLGKQRAELEKVNNQMAAALQRQQGLRQQLTKKLMSAKEEFEAMKNKFIESYKHQQSHFQFQIRQIQTQMNNIMMERHSLEEGHANQISELTKKNQELLKRLQEQSTKSSINTTQEIQSLKIQISELKVKIKHHEEIYLNLEKDYSQKEKQVTAKSQFIEKVREYVVKIEEQNREKDGAIRQRDEFIAKAKEFITNKEAEMLAEVERYKKQISNYKERAQSSQKLRNDLSFLSNQNKEKQRFMGDVVRESNDKQQRIQQLQSQNQQMNMILTQMQRKIQEMQGYIQMQNERFQTNMDEVQQLNRKIKSQQETLEDLVKKNLDMEIQINLKNFELRSIRGR